MTAPTASSSNMGEKESSGIKGRVGGRRPGAGRPKGRKNDLTLQIEAAAQKHGKDAIAALVKIAKHGESEAARIAAATAILDRGFGKPRQAVEHSGPDKGPIPMNVWLFGGKEIAF